MQKQKKPVKTIFRTRTNSRGQITIPRSIRALLGIQPLENILLEVDGSSVSLKPAAQSVTDVFGSVQPLARTLTESEIATIIADQTAQSYGKGK